MFACLFFGDSLALGTADAVNRRLPERCEVRAVRGAASTSMLRWSVPERNYDTAILSIGSNDDIGTLRSTPAGALSTGDRRRRDRVFASITHLRRNLSSRRVIWILPYDRGRATIVQTIAARYGDELLDMRRFATRDGIHPVSYRMVGVALLR